MQRKNLKILSVILFLFFESSGIAAAKKIYGGNNEYNVANIPASLIRDAGTVIRKNIIRFRIEDDKHAVETVTKAVTIFNKEEQNQGLLVIWYDQFREVDDLDGAIYDANGNEIRDMDDDDVKDYSSFSAYSLYDDTREKVAEMFYDKFPYTVEYTYKLKYDGYLQWPAWYSRESLDPVELSRFEVTMPEGDTLRYWYSNDSLKPVIASNDDRLTYLWEAKDLPQLSEDISGNDDEDYAGIVRIAPSKFEIDGYKGDMNSWKNFGMWAYNLYNGQDILSEEATKKIQSLVSPEDNKTQIIKKLYRYMQSTTRYVSIQLGIGSWKPLNAQFVYEKGYGDCKALSNYMMTLLRAEDIKSYPVLINAGNDRPIISKFPSNQFNHVILCVPQKEDTIWLECTSSIIPFGHLSNATENKYALLLSKNGGTLVRTPSSSSLSNTQIREATVELSPKGDAEVNAVTAWRGDQQDGIRIKLASMTPDDKDQWVSNSLNALNPEVLNYHFSVPKSSGNNLKLFVKYNIHNYGSRSAKRIFFKPNLINRYTYVPGDISRRLSPVRFGYPYFDSDSVYFKIPEDYAVEAVPPEVNLNTSFGNFSSKTIQSGDTAVVFTRRMEIKKYNIPAEEYSEYRKFFYDIVKADRAQVVLHRK